MGRNKRRKHRSILPMPADPVPNSPRDPTPSASDRKLAKLHAEVSAFRGPLPPPQVLREYDQILPGLAERIVTMAENQSRHRQDMERTVIPARSRNETVGQVFAFILAVILALGSIWLISKGMKLEGLATIIAEMAALSGVFIYGRKKQEKELAQKRRELIETE